MQFSRLLILALAVLSLSAKPVANNRVLAVVNDKPISVIDIMKKMDFLYYREHSDQLRASDLRFRFYMSNWKDTFQNALDKELVLQDAEEQNMAISAGDVREELEEIFGPNVILNLEAASLTYDEAFQMIRSDIIIRRMLQYHVNSRALQRLTPQSLHAAYDRYKEQLTEEQFVFSIITARGESKDAIELAERAHEALCIDGIALDDLQNHLQATSLTITQAFTQKRTDLTGTVYEVLSQLGDHSCSEPIIYQGRAEQTVRMYYLHQKMQAEKPSFAKVAEQLKNDLTQLYMREESDRYFDRLRKQYDVAPDQILASLPQGFVPFELR